MPDIDMSATRTMTTSSVIEEGAERGEHIIRPQGDEMKRAQQKLREAMAVEDDPASDREGLPRVDHDAGIEV